MSFAKVHSAQTHLLRAHVINVEVDVAKGLHLFNIVGLPDKAVEEARDRVSAAIKNSGFTSPKSKNQKIVVSLAPANIRKEGSAFDLAIALAYLQAVGDIHFESSDKLFLGELSLDGFVRPINGVLSIVKEAKAKGFSEVYVPTLNKREAALIDGISVFAVDSLREVVNHLEHTDETHILKAEPITKVSPKERGAAVRLYDIRGQDTAKRGLLIAAAGGHNIALYGPPGTGKTMLARAFSSILPPLSFEEMLEATSIHSIAGHLDEELVTFPPFRTPHHTSSYVSVVGGGSNPKPGEITLAHHGVLFMDEFPEFDRRVIDALRQPLEDRIVHIARAKGTAVFPARFILVAALNPCPCGNFGSSKPCVCTPSTLLRYSRKISGPIVDRIDMWIDVPHVAIETLSEKESGEDTTESVRECIKKARSLQHKRIKKLNSELSVRDLTNTVRISGEAKNILDMTAKKYDLSPRAYHRVIKLARTIADLNDSEEIGEPHILEALQYRLKQTQYV